MERLRGSSHQRKDDHHELQIGRLKQDRVRLPRGEDVSSGNMEVQVLLFFVRHYTGRFGGLVCLMSFVVFPLCTCVTIW